PFVFAPLARPRSPCSVLMRAMSRRVLRISPGVSSRSVADWKRRWNRFFSNSARVRPSCSSLIPRYSLSLARRGIFPSPLVRLPRHEAALERHLVGDAGQALAGRRLGQAADLEEDRARLDHRRPELRLALALAHARLRRDRRDALVREDADVE